MNQFFDIIKKIIPWPLADFLRPLYHHVLAFLAATFYFFPSRKLIVIGVTGTNGKSTVVELLHIILQEAGFKTGSISSLRFKIGEEERKNLLKMTMPGRFALQKFLRECVSAGCKYGVLEVTSEGIKQYRNKFIKFDVAVMTNVTPEHIESHGSFEKYLGAKLKLFEQVSRRGRSGLLGSPDLQALITNSDDPNHQKFLKYPASAKYIYNSSFLAVEKNGLAERLPIYEKSVTPEGISFKLQNTTISSRLIGEFNLYNILAAISVALSQNIKLETIKSALAKISGIPGRLEFIQKKPFAVVVDYAHTPDALRKVYKTLREPVTSNQLLPKHRLICVLGSAGGGRDKWKRPEMGKIAAEFCDEIILTNEDPYNENPQIIIENIESGFSQIPNHKSPYQAEPAGFRQTTNKSKIQNYKKILDRREAIREAIKSAKPGDTVVITGKGAEPYIMGPNNQKILWDDRKIVIQELSLTKEKG